MQGVGYSVDMVFCIDKTGSMGPIIETVKKNALRFHSDLERIMEEKQKNIGAFRLRVIAFGDCYVDGENWLESSEFYELPDQSDAYNSFVTSLAASGGGDEPENGLEAVSLAIQSGWSNTSAKTRHVVVVWTDASSHKLEKSNSTPAANYPDNIPASFDDLTDLWEGQSMNAGAKRMVLFTPDAYPWTDIETHWSEVVMFPSKAGDGLNEYEYEQILDMLSNSI